MLYDVLQIWWLASWLAFETSFTCQPMSGHVSFLSRLDCIKSLNVCVLCKEQRDETNPQVNVFLKHPPGSHWQISHCRKQGSCPRLYWRHGEIARHTSFICLFIHKYISSFCHLERSVSMSGSQMIILSLGFRHEEYRMHGSKNRGHWISRQLSRSCLKACLPLAEQCIDKSVWTYPGANSKTWS